MYYVPKRLTPDTKHVKVESGFGLSKNEANLKLSANSIGIVTKLANTWTEPKQGMSKFPMNDKNMYSNHMKVNEPQRQGNTPTANNLNSRNLD